MEDSISNYINIDYVDVEKGFQGFDENLFLEIVKNVCRFLELVNVEISFILCNDKYIQEINNNYRKKNKPTDVISFAYREEEFPTQESQDPEILGDIFLSLETAYAQSIEYEVTFPQELARLISHSILHLIGYDHEKNELDAEKMFLKEDEIIRNLGVRQ